MPTSSLLSRSSNKAAALIIVLAFVVLVTGLALAYFSRTTIDRQLAQSSYNDTSADLLARSALDVVVGDFKQEMVNGSMSPAPISGALVPSPSPNVVPRRNVNGDPTTGIPNLIRISLRGDPIASLSPLPAPAVASRASAVNSTDPSANSRSISTTRWNKHCLIKPAATGATINNPIPTSPIPFPTPISGQTPATWDPPDWVIVTRNGPTVETEIGTGSTALNNPVSTNGNYAIGRYAYAVYDEGGLLDANVAGFYPPSPATPIPEWVTDVGRKGIPVFADLVGLLQGGSGNPSSTIVGFRNYATTGQSNVSNFNFLFPNSAVDKFVTYFLGSPAYPTSYPKVGVNRDFGVVNNALDPTGTRTDQSFITRAELINFVLNTTLSDQNRVILLQYLGTFSREQNKPTLPLTPGWTFPREILPQRFYLGNLNLAVYPSPTPTPIVTPTPTGTPTLAPTTRTVLGLQFVSAASPMPTPPPPTPTATPTPSPCTGQVRWEYVGNQDPNPNPTPALAIPPFPSDLTTLDFFQYINYALFGVIGQDFSNIAYTLGIGAALIDVYDADGTSGLLGRNKNALITGIYYGSSSAPCPVDGIPACLVYGAEQDTQLGSAALWYVSPSCISPPPPTPQPFGPTSNFPPLNNTFRSVGEFGWAYSILNAANNRNTNGIPNFVIDFKDPYDPNAASLTYNPDPALLDFFTFNKASVRSGIVSLNTHQAPVIAALLKSANYQGTGQPLPLSSPQASAAANSIVNDSTNGTRAKPALSRADIARLASAVTTAPFTVAVNNPNYQDIKDTFARVFSELTQTRTWGLLIDVVAQTGHYAPNAASGPNTTNPLANFVVEGEKRYWLHIAIDRFDGTVVGTQLEEVTE